MKKNIIVGFCAVLLLSGCGAGKYISADRDLEEIYVGKSYYEIVSDFGQPDASIPDGMEGSKMAYNSVSLSGTKAASLYRQHHVRNRVTKREGAPNGGITFSLDANMKCYAVDSDFQRERDKEAAPERPSAPEDTRMPIKVKPKIPRSIDYPYIKSQSPNSSNVYIEKVEVERDYVRVYFMYRDRTPDRQPITNQGLFVMPEVYVEDCNSGKRFAMTKADGIALYPERSRFAENQGGYDVLLYSLTFEPLDEETEYINIVEPGHSGRNYYGVDVRTPLSTKEELKQTK